MYSDGSYLQRNPDWHQADSAWKAGQIGRIVDDHNLEFETVIEVGCGAGGVLAELAKRWPGKRLEGFDVSPDAAGLWSRHKDGRVTYKNADFLAADQAADLILLVDVFEHIPDYMGFLRRLSASGKAFVFHIPLDMHVSALLRDGQIRVRHQVGHLHYFSRATALATLRDCGYHVLDARFTALSQETVEGRRGLATSLANLARRVLSFASTGLAAKLLGGYSLLVLAVPASKKGRGNALT